MQIEQQGTAWATATGCVLTLEDVQDMLNAQKKIRETMWEIQRKKYEKFYDRNFSDYEFHDDEETNNSYNRDDDSDEIPEINNIQDLRVKTSRLYCTDKNYTYHDYLSDYFDLCDELEIYD